MAPDQPSGQTADDEAAQFARRERQAPTDPDLSDTGYTIYECRECENIVLALGSRRGEMTCHGEAMMAITDWEIDIEPPDLRQVLLDAFGLPKTGLDICLCVIGEGPLAPGEVADMLGYDRSTISRYLNELVEIGLLQKSRLNREEGGTVSVYHSIDLAKMRRDTLVGFYVWAGEAASLIEKANGTKEEYHEEDYSEELREVFWDEFRRDT